MIKTINFSSPIIAYSNQYHEFVCPCVNLYSYETGTVRKIEVAMPKLSSLLWAALPWSHTHYLV